MVLKKQIVALPTIQSRRGSKLDELGQQSVSFLTKIRTLIGWKNGRISLNHRASKCKTFVLLFVTTLSIWWGLLTSIHKPLDMLMNFRLEMTPGFPQYEWWVNPPQVVLLRAYIFNVTNAESFLEGSDQRLKLQEIGPIIYREVISHRHPRHNPNGTLTYVSNKSLEYLPEMNTINLDDTIIAPNLGVLLIPAYFQNSPFFVKWGLNTLLKTYKAKPFVNMTIRDYLLNSSDPILSAAETVAPSLVPTKNLGMLSIVYMEFENSVTVFIGEKHGNSKFFTVDKFDGSEFLPHFSPNSKCQVAFKNASEGLCYPQMITKDSKLSYWRKTTCKQSDIRYVREESRYDVTGYRFELANWTYDREGDQDCFAGLPQLPDGLADASPCYWGFPIVVSFPHYLNADPKVWQMYEGLNPNQHDHGSFVIIEPTTGLPLEGKARAQVSLMMKNMDIFIAPFHRLKNTLIPVGWIEYHQVGLPSYMQWLVYVAVVIVPSIQLPLTILSLVIGFVCFYLLLRLLLTKKVPKVRLYKCELVKDQMEQFMSTC